MSHKVTLIPGDGIGPEVTQGHGSHPGSNRSEVRMGDFRVGAEAYEKTESTSKEVIESIERNTRRTERAGHHVP